MIVCALAGNANSGSFNNRGSNGNFWSSSESGANAWNRNLNSASAQVNRNANDKTNGLSVRCLQDSFSVRVRRNGAMESCEPVPPLLRDLFRAYYDCRRRKRGTLPALRFELDYESHLFRLYEELVNRTYEIAPSTCFIIESPVKREIFAGDFRDRIVHHLIFNYLSPYCERLFIYDSYGCRKGKGVSCGIRRADHFIRSCSQNYTEDCFVLRLDISGYFMSINRSLLFEKVRAIIERYRYEITFDMGLVFWLLKKIIFHDHTKNCLIKGNRESWIGLPTSKSLFYAKPDCGLPIGNLTSQLFGNIYLNGLDQFVSRTLSHGRYGRYVDDFLLIHPDKSVLKECVSVIREYLFRELSLQLHPKKIYLQHYTKGVSFLGAVLKRGHIVPCHRLKGSLYRIINRWNVVLENRHGCLSREQATSFLSSINSVLGGLSAYRTRHLRRSMLGRLSPFIACFALLGSPYRKMALRAPNTLLGFQTSGQYL